MTCLHHTIFEKRKEILVNIGDRLLVKQPRQNKLPKLFKPYPCRIISKKDTLLTAKFMSTNHEIAGNQTHFKSIPETAIVSKNEKVEHELEEETNLKGAGRVVECENEALRHNRPRHYDLQRKAYPKQNRHPIYE